MTLLGDASRDLLIPDRWRSLTVTFERVTFSPSQKGHKELKNCQVVILNVPGVSGAPNAFSIQITKPTRMLSQMDRLQVALHHTLWENIRKYQE